MTNTLFSAIASRIESVTHQPIQLEKVRSIGGGSINSAYQLQSEAQSYFVKCNQAQWVEMFAAEAEGLVEIARTQTVKVPQLLCWGIVEDQAYLVMEYLELGSLSIPTSTQLGTQLAQLHQITQSAYGWHRNNTIGSTPQLNPWTSNWINFYREYRLNYQLKLARMLGHDGSWLQDAERLMANLEGLFQLYQPQPSLLHGDLWGGNAGADPLGHPVIFDPAVYYGDRETDLAMTELFGGFSGAFYAAYRAAYPLDPGYERRRPLYQLYHLLNHLNLFGSGYLGQVKHSIQACLSYL